MPFVRLHISREICRGPLVADVASAINTTIASALSIPLERVKTVIHHPDAVFVGTTPTTSAYLEVTCMVGRDRQVISAMSDSLQRTLQQHIHAIDSQASCSVYITETPKHLLTTDSHSAVDNCPR